MTNDLRKKKIILQIISVVLNFGPLVYFLIKGFLTAEIQNKITLGLTIVIVLIMTAVSLVNKVALKSRLWILLIGLYMALDYIMIPLIMIAACQIIDEIVICPLLYNIKSDLRTSKLLDKRLNNE